MISAVGLLAARFVWFIDAAWFVPYGLFRAWLIGAAIHLIRNPTSIERAR